MLVEEVSQFNQIRSEILDSEVVGIDTETNFTDRPGDRWCLGVSIATDANTYYIPVGHETGYMGTPTNIPIPTDLFDGVTVPIVAHNVKFDYQVLRKIGIDLTRHNLWDSWALSHYHCEWNAKHGGGHKLEQVAPRYLGVEVQKETKKAKAMRPVWTIVPPELMAEYAEQDARLPVQLYKKLIPLMEPAWINQWETADREFMLLLADMEDLGIPIDRDLSYQLEQKCLARMAEIREELGFDPAKDSLLHPKLFLQPPDGLGLIPSSLTPTGKPQVSLEWLQGVGHPVTALIYEYRKTQKQVSSYFSPYLNLTTRHDPRLRCSFKQYGTETGRMSCEIPNLQQLPRLEYKDAKVKEVFLNEEGQQLWEIDFRTLEYRLMAVYCKQPELLQLFKNEGDLHQMVAEQVGVDRHTAKNKIVYAIAYGAGDKTIATGIGKGLKEGYEIVQRVKNSYPLLFRTMDECQTKAESDMEVRMWNGRKRHFRYPSECHKAFNAVIQGGAFELVKRSMLKLRQAGVTMSNQVHDSVWINVDSEAEVIEAQHLMEDWTESYFGLRFSTDRKLMKK